MRVATFSSRFSLSLWRNNLTRVRGGGFSRYIPTCIFLYLPCLGGRCAETFSFCVPQHTFGTMNWTLYMLQECQIPCHSCIHSFITQSCGRSSRALWTALCSSIHVAPPTLVLIDQQHANKGSIIRIRYMRCSSIRFLWTWTTHTLSFSLSLSVPSKKDIPEL